MKKFKNVFLLAAMAVSVVCVTSCGKDDDTCTVCGQTATAEDLEEMSCAEAKALADAFGCDGFSED